MGKRVYFWDGRLEFNSRVGEIGHRITRGSPPLQLCARRRSDAEIGLANSLRASAFFCKYNKGFLLSAFDVFLSCVTLNASKLFFHILSAGIRCFTDPSTDRNTPVASIFTRKRPCPFPIDCQSYSQWKFNFATIQLNRF